MTSRRVRTVAVLGLLALPWGHGGAAPPERRYSISLEVVYGEHPARESYLREIERALEAWVARTGPLQAPREKGVADLHLRVTMNRIERQREVSGIAGPSEVLFEPSARASRAAPYSVLFEFAATLLDPASGQVLVQKEMTVFNEQRWSEVTPDPQQRAWDVGIEFLIDRVEGLLRKNRKRILAHLEQREEAAQGGTGDPR